MKKVKDPELFRLIKEFLGTYLPSIRQRSDNTVDSHRYALNLYLEYIQKSKNRVLSDVVASDFNQADIIRFMECLKSVRKNECSTINQRLSHIRTFCEYLHKNRKISYSDLNDISEIARVKDTRKQELVYLSIEDTRLVLKQPDTSKKNGMRDKFFMALLYDSGCRDQELLDLKVKDFVIKRNEEAELHIIGKGKKYRVTPVTEEVVKLYKKYCSIYHPDKNIEQEKYLFYTVRNGIVAKMSSDNVKRFLNEYEKKAKKKQPKIPHLHAHLFRHTRAMHLYMAGVPLPLVAEWLGHSNLETTQIYAQATVDMKRKAAEKLANDEKSVFKNNVTFKYADDEDILKKLSGLK
jgi:integrase/recombinase XerD